MERVFQPRTKDNEVKDIEDVVVEEARTETITRSAQYNLRNLTDGINTLQEKIDILQAKKAELEEIKTLVQAEAEKITLATETTEATEPVVEETVPEETAKTR